MPRQQRCEHEKQHVRDVGEAVGGGKRTLGCCAELLGRPKVLTVRVQDGQSLTNAGI